MAEVRPRRRLRKGSPAQRHLVLADENGLVYFVSADRLGTPIDDPTLRTYIKNAIAHDGPLHGVTYARLVEDGDAVFAICGRA
jgi:hypothetical protein